MEWMLSFGNTYWTWEDEIHRYHEEFYGTRIFNKKLLEMQWGDYHEDVMNYFSSRPKDLMVINIDDGFDLHLLCDFLGIPYRELDIEKVNPRRNATNNEKIKYFIFKWFGRSWMNAYVHYSEGPRSYYRRIFQRLRRTDVSK
jgi:hypothetical protein